MNRLRTALFKLVFYTLTVPIVLGSPVAALFGQRAIVRYAHWWTGLHRWCARTILGIATRVEGAPYPGPALYAAKHESLYETFELAMLIDGPVTVVKRELTLLPLWGWAIRRYGAIGVDRAASASALRIMLKEGEIARKAGRSVLIYPEGTRVAHGETPPLHSGFAGLYRALDLPVVPIAVDSGRLWPRRGPRHPGVITIRFGAPIPPGLPRKVIEAQVHAAINALQG